MTDYFETGSFRDKGSWHGKEMETGGLFTGQVSIREQAEKSGMLYEVHKLPAIVALPDGGQYQVPNQYMLMREPTAWSDEWVKLRAVSGRYNPIQNQQLIDLLEPLQKDWPIEGMGVLRRGTVVFFELKLDPYDVGGEANEKHLPYLLCANDHTQGSAVWGLTTTRVVCANTFAQSLRDKTVVTIPHNTDVTGELSFRADLVQYTINARKEQQLILNRMFNRKLENGELNAIVEKVFPYPKPGRATRLVQEIPQNGLAESFTQMQKRAKAERGTFESNRKLADSRRQAVADAYVQFGDEQPYAGDTAYALFNAVTQVTNHSSLFTGGAEKNAVSLLFGQKQVMNTVAWQECVKLVA